MSKTFTANDFDTVYFICNGNESQELLEAKEYLKDIQMTFNIGDVSDSLQGYVDEPTLFSLYAESVFSSVGLDFLEKVKYRSSFKGLDVKQVEKADFKTEGKDNFYFLNRNLINHAKEFITAIWDCILLIKMAHKKGNKSILVDLFNHYFAQLTSVKTGNAQNYKAHEDPLAMICELVLFMQTYISDYIIFLIKSNASLSSSKEVVKANKKFVTVFSKSSKIALRNEMFELIKSKNYPLLLKLLIEQKHAQLV